MDALMIVVLPALFLGPVVVWGACLLRARSTAGDRVGPRC